MSRQDDMEDHVQEVGGRWRARAPRSDIDATSAALRSGRIVVLVDDLEHGCAYLVQGAETASAESVAFLVTHSTGYLRVAIPEAAAQRMGLPLMVPWEPAGTGYTVTVDAASCSGTGISATDRAHTIRLLAASSTQRADFTRPGHVAPVQVPDDEPRWTPARAGLELLRGTGAPPAAVYAELVAEGVHTDLATVVEASIFASAHGLKLLRLSQLALTSSLPASA